MEKVIQKVTAAYQLAEVVLSMDMVSDRGLVARRLAREVIGIDSYKMQAWPKKKPADLPRILVAAGQECVSTAEKPPLSDNQRKEVDHIMEWFLD